MSRLADALERAQALASQPAPVSVGDVARSAASGGDVDSGGDVAKAASQQKPSLQQQFQPKQASRRLMLVDPEPADVVSGRAHARSKSTLTRFNPALVGKLVGTPGVPSLSMEQYRKVAATLHHLQLERGVKVIMVSSAVPSEGKTLTATNLALTLSESYRRKVLIIDADLRRPTLHQIFDLPNISGLNDGLKADIDRPLPLVQVSQTLTVLTAGRPDPDPMSGLTSSRMKRVIEEAQGFAEWVIVDTPPVGLLPDARLLSNMVDGALLVIRAGRSPFELVRRAVEGLGHDRILGVVFNDVQDVNGRASGYYGYGGYYYGPREKP